MCGNIVGALSMSLPAEVRGSRIRLVLFSAMFNSGRIFSYVAAGLVAGAFGVEILKVLGLQNAHGVLRYVGVVLMIAIGFYLAGWFPQMARVERIGQPIWRRVEPIAKKMIPVNTYGRALLYGMAWGWLPCGMVYMVLLMTVTAGSAVQGGYMMLAFGLGTMPSMFSAGVMAGWIRRMAGSSGMRQAIGVLITVMAIASLFVDVDHAHQHH
jgi:sulfite exporter TauE/SafE